MADVTRKPNIVFILCDNVGWGDFAVYGGGTPTPRIDQLAGDYQKSIAQYPNIKTGAEFEGYEGGRQ